MLGNKLSRVGVGGGWVGVWVAGLTENKTKPSSLGLAELGNMSIYSLSSLSFCCITILKANPKLSQLDYFFMLQ